jgi:hypothetical protein
VRLIGEREATWAGYLGRAKFDQLKRLLADLADAEAAEERARPRSSPT